MSKEIEKPSPEQAIDIAVQATKLLIALATSVLAFTVTFSKEINDGIIPCVVKISWFFLIISIVAGVFILQKIIGELAKNHFISLYECSIKQASMIQNLSFILGILLIGGFMLMR